MNEDFDYLLNAPVTEEEKTYIDVLETPEEEQDTVPVSIAAPEASEEDLDKLLLAVQQQEINEEKATWDDVLKSGGLRSYAGFAQVFLSMAETAGAVPKGKTAEFTRSILAAEQTDNMSLGQTLARDTLADSLIIAADIYATKGQNLKTSLKRTTAIGAGGGLFTFVEDPEQAGALSSARLLNSTLGATLAPVMMASTIGLGRLGSSVFYGGRGDIAPANIELRPGEIVRQEGAETIEQAAERGLVLTPGQATADPALLSQELKTSAKLSDDSVRYIADIMGSNAKNLDELIDDLVATIIPEGKEGVAEAVLQLYAKADADIVPSEMLPNLRTLKGSPAIENAISKIKKNPITSSVYNAQSPNSIGQLRMILRNLQDQIDNAAGDEQQFLIAAKKQLETFADEASPAFKAARATSQREKTAAQVVKSLKTKGEEVVPLKDRATAFVNAFENVEAKESLKFAIDNLPTSKAQKEATAKFNLLLEFIPRISSMNSYLESLLKLDPSVLEARSNLTPEILYTLMNLIHQNNDRNFIRFILDPERSAARLRDAMPPKTTPTEDTLKILGVFIEENFNEYDSALGLSTESFMRNEETEAFKSSSASSKSKAFEKMMKAGTLDDLKQKNPEAYNILFSAYQNQAVA